MASFYDLEPARQQRASLRRLFTYLRGTIEPFHPFLRRLYRQSGIDLAKLRTADDLRRLPIVGKSQLREDAQAFVLRPAFPGVDPLAGYETEPAPRSMLARYAMQAALNVPRDFTQPLRRPTFRERIQRRAQLEWLPIHFHASSGSTGHPTPAVYTHYDLNHVVRRLAAVLILPKRRDPDGLYYDLAERGMSLFPGAPHLAFFSTVLAKQTVGTSSFETCGGQVIPTDRQIALFAGGGFTSLLSVPSYLTYWLRRARTLQDQGQMGGLSGLRHIVLGAEPINESLRETIRELALAAGARRVKVYETFGMTEMKWWFGECDEGSGLHLNPRYYYWELLDPRTREPVPEGEPGVLVFSHIDWRGTAVVRYWTGDLVKGGMFWNRCRFCGYTFPRIYGPICRAEKDFTKIKGTLVDLTVLVDTVRRTPGVRLFQITLSSEPPQREAGRDCLAIEACCEPGTTLAEVERQLRERLKTTIDVSPDRLELQADEESLRQRLFLRSPVKAEYVVEIRAVHL